MQTIEWTLHTKILFFLALLSFLTGFLFFNIFSALVGSFILIFLLYSKYCFKLNLGTLSISRQIIETILYVNHPCHVKTILTYNGGKINLEIQENPPPASQISKGTSTKNIQSSSTQTTLPYQLIFHHRGRHHFPPVKITIQDTMKLYQINTTIPAKTTVLVHSDPLDIQKAKRSSTMQDDTLVIPSLTGVDEQVEFEGIKTYMPGDLIRYIDWKATARLQKLVSKTFEKKESLQSIIFLDVSQSMRRSFGSYTKLDHAVSLVIQLAAMLQKQHHTVGFAAYDEYKVLTRLQPSYDYQPLYKACATLPSSKTTSSYYPNFTTNPLTQTSKETEEHKLFLSTISPFISKIKKQIQHRIQTTGIYQAVTPFLSSTKKTHFIYITDMETNQDCISSMITRAHLKHHKQWLLTIFTPWYDTQHHQKNSLEHIEHIYTIQQVYTKQSRLFYIAQKKAISST
jgi:uncharacterized protein (DUF58 family)